MERYPALCSWRDPRKRQEGRITDTKGKEVHIDVIEEPRSLIVTDVGALSWVLGDFQALCKNIKVSGKWLTKQKHFCVK